MLPNEITENEIILKNKQRKLQDALMQTIFLLVASHNLATDLLISSSNILISNLVFSLLFALLY